MTIVAYAFSVSRADSQTLQIGQAARHLLNLYRRRRFFTCIARLLELFIIEHRRAEDRRRNAPILEAAPGCTGIDHYHVESSHF